MLAAPVPARGAVCDPFFLQPVFLSYPEDTTGGSLSGSFNVWLGLGQGNCTWRASTPNNWIHITGGETGMGLGGPGISGTVTYDVQPNTGGQARFGKIFLRAENTTSQYIEHTVFQDGWTFQPVKPLKLMAIDPDEGEGNTLIRVIGEGFDTDFNGLAAGLLIDSATVLPLQTVPGGLPDLLLKAPASAVGTAGARPMVTRGQGRTGFFRPAFADVVLREPAWVWTGNAESVTGVSEEAFTLRPSTPPPGTQWFFSGPPANGTLCVQLTGNGFPSNRVSIHLFADNPPQHIHRAARLVGIEPGGQSLPDGAKRIADAIGSVFNQLGQVAVNVEVQNIGAAVALKVSFPEGPIMRGGLLISFEPPVPSPAPEIISFSPGTGDEGTLVTIVGRNLGSNPRNVSAAVLNGGVTIPLEVVSASETQVVAFVGGVPAGAAPGPIQIMKGSGRAAPVGFDHPDIRQPAVVGTFSQTDPGATSRDSFIPQARPGGSEWPKCFYSSRPVGGQVCVIISGAWPTPAKVSISAALFDTAAGKGHAIQADDVVFEGAIIPGNPPIVDPLDVLDCAYRICDVITSSLHSGGLQVNCTVELVAPGEARICLSAANSFVDQGHLNVCVEPLDYLQVTSYPAITDFYPKEGSPGDVIRIMGRNFLAGSDTAPDPAQPNVSIVNGSLTIPMETIQASDTEVLAVLGHVPPNARPGRLRVTVGRGSSRVLQLPPPFTDFKDVSWNWSGGGASAESSQDFNPRPGPLSPGEICLYSGAPVDGKLTVETPFAGDPYVSLGPFPNPALVEVDLEAVSDCYPAGVKLKRSGIVHLDPSDYYTTLEGDGAYGLFEAISDHLLIFSFFKPGEMKAGDPYVLGHAIGSWENPQPTVGMSMDVLAFWPPELVETWGCAWTISAGHLNVCIRPVNIFLPPPQILDIFPSQARAGEIVHITGQGFGYNPKDLSLVLWNGSNSSNSIPFEVLTANGTELTARLGAVPPDAQPGRLQLDFGIGTEGYYEPFFQYTDVRQWQASRRWRGNGVSIVSPNLFTPLPSPPPTNGPAWYFSGAPRSTIGDNGLYVAVPVIWPPNPRVTVSLRAFIPSANTGLELRIEDFYPGNVSPIPAAQRLCDAIQRVARLRQDGLVAGCGVVTPGGNFMQLGVGVGLGRLTAGHFNVCIEPGPPLPVITGVNPREGREGDVITLTGNGFIADLNESPNLHDYALVALGGTSNTLSTPLQVLSITSNQIQARLGPVDLAAAPGPLVLSFGRGQQGSFTPSFGDVLPGANVWTWNQTSLSFTSAVSFTPRVSAPPADTQWFFSGPPINGGLSVTLRGDWPRPALVRVEARARNSALLLERDLRAVDVRFHGGGSTLECAARLCEVIRAAFRQQMGIHMNCALVASPNGDGSVKMTLTLPAGPIDSGHLTICVGPAPPLAVPVIDSFMPASGGEGTLVTILGRNFRSGPDATPEDLSVVIREGDLAIPLEVLSATDTMIEARLGPVPPGARGGPLVVAIGEGIRGIVPARVSSLWPLAPAWAWASGGPTAASAANFVPQPGVPDMAWSFSGPPTGGKLRVVVPTSAWTRGAVVRASLRVQSGGLGLGFDSSSQYIDLQPDPQDAGIFATRLASVLKTYHSLQSTVVQNLDSGASQAEKNLNYETHLLPGGASVEIVVSSPTGVIDWGALNIGIAPPAAPAPIVINDIQPRFGSNGALVRITGRGFGGNSDNLLLEARQGNSSVLLRAISASDTEIIAEVGIGDPNEALAGPVTLTRGLGQQKQGYDFSWNSDSVSDLWFALHPWFSDRDSDPDKSWQFDGALHPPAVSGIDFTVLPGCRSPGVSLSQAMSSGPPQDGKLCVVVPPGLGFINRLFISLQAHNDSLNLARALDLEAWFGYLTPSDGAAKASLFCEYITAAFADQGIAVNCAVAALPKGEARLCFSLPEGPIDWGQLRICLQDHEGPLPNGQTIPIPKLELQQLSGSSLRLCLPRSLTGYQLEATDDLFGNPPGHVNWVPITLPVHVTDTEVQYLLPNGQPHLYFRLARGQPASPGAISEGGVIRWPDASQRDLQSAINDAPDGAILQIQEGAYDFTQPITIRGKRVEIRGAGSGKERTGQSWSMTHLRGPAPSRTGNSRDAVGLFHFVGGGGKVSQLRISGFDAAVTSRDDEGGRSMPLAIEQTVITGSGRGVVWLAQAKLDMFQVDISHAVVGLIVLNGKLSAVGVTIKDIEDVGMFIHTPGICDAAANKIVGEEVSFCGSAGIIVFQCCALIQGGTVGVCQGGGIWGVQSTVEISGVTLDRNRVVGIGAVESYMVIWDNVIMSTFPHLFTGRFGDGVALMADVAPSIGFLYGNEILASARAGVGNFGSQATLGGNTFKESGFDLAGEVFKGHQFLFEDVGSNTCDGTVCTVETVGLAPPEPVGNLP
jgi:hypothetical protein